MKYFFPQFCDTKILTIFSQKRAKLVKFTLGYENQKGTKINKNICHAKEHVWVPTARENDTGSEKSHSKWKVKKRQRSPAVGHSLVGKKLSSFW
jgi:hypothetical protein